MPAPITLPDVAAKRPSDSHEYLATLFSVGAKAPNSNAPGMMGAEDIGQFRPMLFHRWIGTKSSSNESRGLGVERTDTSATCR